jgi:Uma2 family endonuclease
MSTVQTRLITALEFYDWVNRPENRGRICELERGRIVEMSRPGKLHGLVCANLVRILGNYAAQHKKGYVCSNDTGIIVERDPDTVRGPDVMLFDDAESIDQVGEKYAEKPPLLAVEVLSPNDTYSKVRRRVREQFRFGTKLVWILDPDARNVVIHYPNEEDREVGESEELTGNDVLPEFRCQVAALFTLPGRP